MGDDVGSGIGAEAGDVKELRRALSFTDVQDRRPGHEQHRGDADALLDVGPGQGQTARGRDGLGGDGHGGRRRLRNGDAGTAP